MWCGGDRLQRVMTLPTPRDYDRAEGITMSTCWGESCLWVVYDDPGSQRLIGDRALLMDAFRLPAD